MLQLLIAVAGILITIFCVVGIHEFGHFIVARCVGVKILRFSIGFGKTLCRWHDKKGTEYVIAVLPLGGYVKMLDEGEGDVPASELPFAYNQQPFYKKFAIVAAGPLFNLLFAFLIYWAIFMIGFTSIVPLIGKVAPDSIAAQAGLQPQQEITRLDDKQTNSWVSIIIEMLLHAGDKNQIQIETKNIHSLQSQSHTLNLTHWHLDELKPDPLKSLGIIPYQPTNLDEWPKNLLRENKYGPIEALSYAWEETREFTQLNFIIMGKLITGKVSLKSLGGPITIFENAGSALNQGIIPFLSFLAFLSISIGLINILPIPGLDGGHLFLQFIEFVIRRPVSPGFQILIYRLGLIILLMLVTQAIINDISRL